MTFLDRQAQLDTERQLLHEASQRLLAGNPQRSSGALTVSTMAIEAGLARHRLYEHHTDLITEFQNNTRGGPIPPHVTALQQQLADAQARIQQLEANEALLQARIKTLGAVVAELTHEAHAGNVVALPRKRR